MKLIPANVQVEIILKILDRNVDTFSFRKMEHLSKEMRR